jgi:hypothetical protein
MYIVTVRDLKSKSEYDHYFCDKQEALSFCQSARAANKRQGQYSLRVSDPKEENNDG